DMVAFTGRCLVHRAEILQLGGSWADALEEARRAAGRFVEPNNPTAVFALYREAELLRLQGDLDGAEEAYRAASRAGWETQPGLAQLRLRAGRRDRSARAAGAPRCASTRRRLQSSVPPLRAPIHCAAQRCCRHTSRSCSPSAR